MGPGAPETSSNRVIDSTTRNSLNRPNRPPASLGTAGPIQSSILERYAYVMNSPAGLVDPLGLVTPQKPPVLLQ